MATGVPSYSSSSSSSTETTDLSSERTDTTSGEIHDKSPAVSILQRLKSPTPDLARKRKVPTNPPKGVKKSKAQVANEPSFVSISDRIKQFSNESMCNSRGKLFCNACREPLSIKKSVIAQHIKSAKHESGKAKLDLKEKRERLIVDMLAQYNKNVHPGGEGLKDEVHVHRVKVLTTFMRAGIPLNKIDACRELLEENSYQLCDSSHLHDLIPFIHKQEQQSVQDQISGKNMSVIFDGTTHVCEALAIILQFATGT